MSFLKNIRKKNFGNNSNERTEDKQNGRRGSTSSTFSLPGSLHVRRNRKESVNSEVITFGPDQTPIEEGTKIEPSKYLYLINSDPLLDWEEYNTEINELESVDELSIKLKVFKNKTRNIVSVCRVLSKFSEDSFDDYLFEIGILTEIYPKFDDYVAEIEALRECRATRNVLNFYDAYYFDSKLWVRNE
jgi:hypothetical protein